MIVGVAVGSRKPISTLPLLELFDALGMLPLTDEAIA